MGKFGLVSSRLAEWYSLVLDGQSSLGFRLHENVEHYLVTLPWGTHGCDFNLSGPTGQISTFAIEVFLKKIITK